MPFRRPFLSLVEDYLAGLGAAKRSEHTIGARADLVGVAGRIAARLHGTDATAAKLTLDEVDKRTMTKRFASWASDHAEASVPRAWGVWHRFFENFVDDEILDRNPMRGVPNPKLPQTRPRSIRHPDPAELLLATAASEDLTAKPAKRWPQRDVAIVATFRVPLGDRLSTPPQRSAVRQASLAQLANDLLRMCLRRDIVRPSLPMIVGG